MSKKNSSTPQDEYEKEYGPMQTIYVSENAQKRLNGDEEYGKWYETCQYTNSPTTEFCIKTIVPEGALEDGLFHPDRFEPDIVAERCEKVSDEEISQSLKKQKVEARKDPAQQRIKKLKNLRSGDQFAYKNVGFGLTSYEEGGENVWRKSGKLFTPTFDSEGMSWNGQTWKYDGGLGMTTYLVLLEDVPEEELPTGWKTTRPPKRKTKPVTLRFQNPKGKYEKGEFVWSDREKTWIEVCDGPDGRGLYKKDGWRVIGWK